MISLPSTHHNFAVWLREIVKERFYCTADFKVTRNAFGRPVGTTLKLDFNGRWADGWALSFVTSCRIASTSLLLMRSPFVRRSCASSRLHLVCCRWLSHCLASHHLRSIHFHVSLQVYYSIFCCRRCRHHRCLMDAMVTVCPCWSFAQGGKKVYLRLNFI